MIKIIITQNPNAQSEFQVGNHDVTKRNAKSVCEALRADKADWQLEVSPEDVATAGKIWLLIDVVYHVMDALAQGRNVFMNGNLIELELNEIVQAIGGNTEMFGGVPRIVQDDAEGLYLMPFGVDKR